VKKTFRTACPMDCFASCGLLVITENGKVVDIKGDPEHPLTRGRVCGKARRHLDRLYHPERLQYPMVRSGTGWQQVSWDEALELWATKLEETRAGFGTTAVLHADASGSNGLLRGLGERFFNVYGGVTRPTGSLCWGAGLAAQALDFGGHQIHEWDDLVNSRTVLLWGRDPTRTNIHLLEHLRRAAAGGAEIISINPVQVRGVPGVRHVCPRPGTDGALALGMAHVIIAEGLVDTNFIKQHVQGYQEFAASLRDFTAEQAADICGVPAGVISELARRYAGSGPAAIVLGFGLQRYTNAGRTIRSIDALAAITGNVGMPGGGVSYTHQLWKQFFADLSGSEFATGRRTFPWPALARYILAADEPPVRCIVVTRCNPLTQLPDTSRARAAFRSADFVVVVDFFLTDTAAEADLVLPCTTFLESEDLVYCSLNNYLSYMPAVVEPLGESKSELEIYTSLARRMGLSDFGFLSNRQWIDKALEPVADQGITLERLKEGPVRNPAAPQVAWADRRFPTDSGKYELFSLRAQAAGLEPLPVYQPPESLAEGLQTDYPLYLLTPHHRDYIHSQFWNSACEGQLEPLPGVEMHPETSAGTGLEEGDMVWVETNRGRLQGIVKYANEISPGVVRVYQGRWHSLAGGVNLLTPDYIADLGGGSCYYDCRCRVYKS